DIDCAGDSTTSISCSTSSINDDGSVNIYIACQDLNGNKDTAGTNTEVTYSVVIITSSGGFTPLPFVTPFMTPAMTPVFVPMSSLEQIKEVSQERAKQIQIILEQISQVLKQLAEAIKSYIF
ncbi:MAG: hypothetical protein HYT35_00550, partial [Candidatus Staskawiczbacteria bacterium]|nr:hypothetical protein [Candidatus Staskawiczbacteria bacterium]